MCLDKYIIRKSKIFLLLISISANTMQPWQMFFFLQSDQNGAIRLRLLVFVLSLARYATTTTMTGRCVVNFITEEQEEIEIDSLPKDSATESVVSQFCSIKISKMNKQRQCA